MLFLYSLGAASKEAYHEDTYPNILHRYLKFDDEMSVISVVWRDCEQLLENYNDEQVSKVCDVVQFFRKRALKLSSSLCVFVLISFNIFCS